VSLRRQGEATITNKRWQMCKLARASDRLAQ
jgi:hypothetical protein